MPAWKDLAAIALVVMLASSAANCAAASSSEASGTDRARGCVAPHCGAVDGSPAAASR